MIDITDLHLPQFPDPEEADEDGLLAMGGDLKSETIISAYLQGIFPWYNPGEPILWWSPNPRFVLFPKELKVSKSMRSILNKKTFDIKVNTDFETVIQNCQQTKRKDEPGTWITNEMQAAYTLLHKQGVAHSVEAYRDGQLVGGLYGIIIGKMFFGESMFSKESNASKAAFITFTRFLIKQEFTLIDCQTHSNHLESLGAKFISRKNFLKRLSQNPIELVNFEQNLTYHEKN